MRRRGPSRDVGEREAELTLTQFNKPCDDDDDEGGHLGVGEEVLHAGPPFHVGRVDEGQ